MVQIISPDRHNPLDETTNARKPSNLCVSSYLSNSKTVYITVTLEIEEVHRQILVYHYLYIILCYEKFEHLSLCYETDNKLPLKTPG